jgi:hypothetical protein
LKRSSPRSRKRSSKAAERRRVAAAVREHSKRFRRWANVLGVGVGVAYKERESRFVAAETPGRRAPLALKVIVSRKPRRLSAADRLPKSVRIRLVRGRRISYVRVPVDVVLQDAIVGGIGSSHAGDVDASDFPQTGFAAPGHRLFAGHADPSAEGAPPPLAAGFSWEIGTVGALASDGTHTYVVTAAHIVTDPYVPGAAFPPRCRVGFALDDRALASDHPAALVPRSPRDGGRVIDVVALPLTAAQARLGEQEPLSVATTADLHILHGQGAVLRVERDDAIIDLPVTVEGDFPECVASIEGRSVNLGPTVLLRCGGVLPNDGDSGAPVLARHPMNGTLLLLGFHIGRTSGTSTSAPTAYAMAAWQALSRARLGLI